jgi:uncharacterized protein (DUF362 family)
MKRRDFLKTTAKATALATICGGTGYLLHNRETVVYKPVIVKNVSFEVPPDSNFPAVSLSKEENIISALNKSLDAIGGVKRFVKSGEKVTIKPNVGWDRTPQQAANTNPILVGEMVRLSFEAGASEVIVTDVTCNDPRRCFLRSGIREASEKAGAKVILAKDEDYIDVNLNGEILTVWPVLKHFVETDRLINMPITKQHSLSTCTLGMKNLYGIIGGQRNRLHQEIDQSIVDLASFTRPTLTIIDCSRVLLRGGPQGGSLDDVAIENTVICTTDQVAGDSKAVEFLGHTGDQISHIVLAEKSGLGMVDYNLAGYKEII